MPSGKAILLPLIAVLGLGLSAIVPGSRPAAAAGETVAQPRAVVVPGFWDPRRRPERPDLSRIGTIRFLTDLDYPPFDYRRRGRQSGRLQCRSRAPHLRRDQGQLHHPGAAVRRRCSTRSTKIAATP